MPAKHLSWLVTSWRRRIEMEGRQHIGGQKAQRMLHMWRKLVAASPKIAFLAIEMAKRGVSALRREHLGGGKRLWARGISWTAK